MNRLGQPKLDPRDRQMVRDFVEKIRLHSGLKDGRIEAELGIGHYHKRVGGESKGGQTLRAYHAGRRAMTRKRFIELASVAGDKGWCSHYLKLRVACHYRRWRQLEREHQAWMNQGATAAERNELLDVDRLRPLHSALKRAVHAAVALRNPRGSSSALLRETAIDLSPDPSVEEADRQIRQMLREIAAIYDTHPGRTRRASAVNDS